MHVFLHLNIKLLMCTLTNPYPLFFVQDRNYEMLKKYIKQWKAMKISVFSSSLTMACKFFSALGFTKRNKPLSLRIPSLAKYCGVLQLHVLFSIFPSPEYRWISNLEETLYYVFYKLWKSLCYLYLECSKLQEARPRLLLMRTAIL